MGHDAVYSILSRLRQAIATKDAVQAVRSVELLPPLFQTPNQDAALRAWVARQCREYGLNADWVLTGHGKPPVAARPVAATPLVPVFAMASVHPQSRRWRLVETERISLPPALLSPSRLVIRMNSRVLEPRIRQQAYLVVDTTQTRVPCQADGPPVPNASLHPIFAVDILDEGLVVRMARSNRESGTLELFGLHPEYPPLTVPGDEPTSRVVGRVVWVIQTL